MVDCVSFTQDGGKDRAPTIGGGQSSIHAQEISDQRVDGSREAGAASVTMSWTHSWSNQPTVHIAFAIKAASIAVPIIISSRRRR